MPELESVNLEHTNLRSFVLQSLDNGDSSGTAKSGNNRTILEHLKEIRLIGNPLRCDCHARWLWTMVKKQEEEGDEEEKEEEGVANAATTAEGGGGGGKISIDLPKCATPFSVRNLKLVDLKGE